MFFFTFIVIVFMVVMVIRIAGVVVFGEKERKEALFSLRFLVFPLQNYH